MNKREFELVALVRRANEELLIMGCPVNGLGTVRQGKNKSNSWNMWVNVREGALCKLVKIRDRRVL
jgi:hypothetical protein